MSLNSVSWLRYSICIYRLDKNFGFYNPFLPSYFLELVIYINLQMGYSTTLLVLKYKLGERNEESCNEVGLHIPIEYFI